jgi:hypothetical protein
MRAFEHRLMITPEGGDHDAGGTGSAIAFVP